MDDDDLGCCLCCCLCGVEAICNRYAFLAAAALTAVLVARPVRATVKDASLSRLDLTAGVGGGPNGTYLAYDLSLTVVLRNRNWAMRAELTAPLDAELRFAGRRFDGARLPGAGRRIGPRGAEEFRVVTTSSPPRGGVALGSDAAAEFATERAAGVFELELKLAGEIRYRPVHVGGGRRLEKTCPVKLLMAPAPASRGTHLMVFDKVVTCY